jgi:Phage integrase central domain/Arm DNA-binding domain
MAVRSCLKRLSQTFVEKHTTPGLYSDGNGLYLQVTAAKDSDYVTKSWIFRYAVRSGKEKRERKMGLGAYPLVSLAMAREMAIECGLKRLRGIDPLEEREADKRKNAVATAKTITFEKAAEQYIATHRAGWRNVRHASQWPNSLNAYVYSIFGEMAVRDIDTGMVMRVLEPIWTTKSVTAGRVRGRIERILDWSKVNGYREGENPARWSGHLDHLLPDHAKIRKVEHQPALPHKQMPAFMTELRTRTGTSARCLEFTILTAARRIEAIAWMRETDPANLQPKVRPLNQRVAEFIRANRPTDDDGRHVNSALDILEAPWPRREEILLRDWFNDNAAAGIDKARTLVARILETGLEPFNQPQLLPPIEPADIGLVCWMGLAAALAGRAIDGRG